MSAIEQETSDTTREKLEALIELVQGYANVRAECVRRGSETPYLAALLTAKHGVGMVRAVSVFLDGFPVGLQAAMDAEVGKLDPAWQQRDRERWAARPAGVMGVCDGR